MGVFQLLRGMGVIVAILGVATFSEVARASEPEGGGVRHAEEVGVTRAIKVNVPFVFAGLLDVQYEKSLSVSSAYSIRGFLATGLWLGGLGGGGIGASYQWFPYAESPLAGFYISPGIDLTYLEIGDGFLFGVFFSPYAMVGYNWVYANNLTLGLVGGVSYNKVFGAIAAEAGGYLGTGSSAFVKAAINLGYCF